MATDCITQLIFQGKHFPKPVVARFDAQYAAHPPLNTVDYFGWEGARAQRSLLTMYDVTRDTAYLDKFLILAAVQRNNWPTRWSGGNWEDDSAQSGNVISLSSTG